MNCWRFITCFNYLQETLDFASVLRDDVCTLCTVNHVGNPIVTAAAAAIAHSVHSIGKWRCDQFNREIILFNSRVNDAQLNSFSFYSDVVYWNIINLHVNAWCAWQRDANLKFNSSFIRTYNNNRSKESNKDPNYNENSIAICSMFTRLKTITVLRDRKRYIVERHLTRRVCATLATIFAFTLNWIFHINFER